LLKNLVDIMWIVRLDQSGHDFAASEH